MDEEKATLIEKILNQRRENAHLKATIDVFEEKNKQLQNESFQFQADMADQAFRELKFLHNERAEISRKSIEEEEGLKKAFEKRLKEIVQEKVDLERALEAESEFVSRNLRQRLVAIHAKTHLLRQELNQKSRAVTDSLLHMSPDEAMQKIIQSKQDSCLEISSKIAESHREIEGLQKKAERYQKILEHLHNQIQKYQNNPLILKKSFFEEQRRKSYTQHSKPFDYLG